MWVAGFFVLTLSLGRCDGGGVNSPGKDILGGDSPFGGDWNRIEPEIGEDQGDIEAPADLTDRNDLQLPETGCGNGICDPDEDQWNCAKDCSNPDWSALFVFAHKGDEWAALGRMHDLLALGAQVQVTYLTSDDTPFEAVYAGQKSALAPAALGVPEDNIFLYELYDEGWPLPSGTHAALDRLSTQIEDTQPSEVYLPQLCGGDLEADLANALGIWALKRSGMFPQPAIYEVPARSNYFILSEPDPSTAVSDPNAFVDLVLQRWKLLPKDSDELKPTVGAPELVAIKTAADLILDEWMVATRDALPDDQYKHLLRMAQRYRLVPESQEPIEPPYLSSIVNPEGTYIYQEQGWTRDEFAQLVRLVESFVGTNLLTDPLHLPGYQEPMDIVIAQDFDISLTIRNIAAEEDVVSVLVGIDEIKDQTDDCQLPPDTTIPGWGEVTVTLHCEAAEEIGLHAFYIRAYSENAKEAFEPTEFAEIPYLFNVMQ